LTTLPIPFLGEKDGGPFISAGVVLAHDQEQGCVNAGVYRMMYRSPRQTSIDLVTVSDLRRSYERAFQRKEPLPITVSIGAHPTGCERTQDRRRITRIARAYRPRQDQRRPRAG
jgi:2,5-furandicarboxylate decarboxylase 1